MKSIVRIVIIAAAFGIATSAAATTSAAVTPDVPADQDDEQSILLGKIEAANNAVETLQAHFDQTRTLPSSGKKIPYEGTLYFTSPSQMSMIYTQPETEIFIINGSSLYMVRDGKEGLYNTEKNNTMRSLSNTLCSCIMGKVSALAQDNDAHVELTTTDEGCLVTLSARKKSTRGYSTIVLLYDKTTYVLIRMELIEFSGISNLYEMSAITTNTTIDSALYAIPK